MVFYRSRDTRVVAGICGALARANGWDPTVVRVVTLLLGGGTFWVYLFLWMTTESR